MLNRRALVAALPASAAVAAASTLTGCAYAENFAADVVAVVTGTEAIGAWQAAFGIAQLALETAVPELGIVLPLAIKFFSATVLQQLQAENPPNSLIAEATAWTAKVMAAATNYTVTPNVSSPTSTIIFLPEGRYIISPLDRLDEHNAFLKSNVRQDTADSNLDYSAPHLRRFATID